MTPLEKLIADLRKEIDAKDAETLANLARAYDRVVYKPLQGDIDSLVKLIEAAKGIPNVANTTEFKRLMADAQEKLKAWQTYLDATATNAATSIIPVGMDHAEQLVRAAGIEGAFRKMEPAQIERLLRYLDEGSPLYQRIASYAPYFEKYISASIIDGVMSGKNPKTIASLITNLFGMPLTDSLRMTRTVQIWSYREAGRASYLANGDVVKGWIWYAELDSETCASCWAMHGTEHSLDETLDDHYNGRCTAIPMTIGASNDIKSGASQFSDLSEAKQREILGDAKFDAWKEGKFEFGQLSTQHSDEIYGSMRNVTSLQDLVGGD